MHLIPAGNGLHSRYSDHARDWMTEEVWFHSRQGGKNSLIPQNVKKVSGIQSFPYSLDNVGFFRQE